MIAVLIVNTLLIYLAVAAARGLYYSLLEEGSIPLALTGTVVGIGSTVAYSSDIFFPITAGLVLDKYPAVQAYRYIFLGLAIFVAVGLVAAIVLRQRTAAKGQKCIRQKAHQSRQDSKQRAQIKVQEN